MLVNPNSQSKRDDSSSPEVPAEAKNPDRIIIPECCREGWDSCKHVPKPYKKSKVNVGL